MEEPADLGYLGAEPREKRLQDEQKEQEAVSSEPPPPDACRSTEDDENQAGEQDDEAEACMKAEQVLEPVLVHGPAILDVASNSKCSITRKADLNEDQQKEQRRPAEVQRPEHGSLPVADDASVRNGPDVLKDSNEGTAPPRMAIRWLCG
jgi:hypothetical protein